MSPRRDNNIEDTLISSSSKEPIFVVEIKGVRGGLRREHVNQVDSHRERLGIPAEVPGLLILNDFMEIDGLEKREVKEFHSLQITHARNLNVRILRTTTLFRMMLECEQLDPDRRATAFLHACSDANPLVASGRSETRK